MGEQVIDRGITIEVQGPMENISKRFCCDIGGYNFIYGKTLPSEIIDPEEKTKNGDYCEGNFRIIISERIHSFGKFFIAFFA